MWAIHHYDNELDMILICNETSIICFVNKITMRFDIQIVGSLQSCGQAITRLVIGTMQHTIYHQILPFSGNYMLIF